MPIADLNDAHEVNDAIERVFGAASPDERERAIRSLFVEALDFEYASGTVNLDSAAGNVQLPPDARRIASLDGVHVCYVDLAESKAPPNRVRAAEAAAAAKRIADSLGEDLLLVFTCAPPASAAPAERTGAAHASQIHVVRPAFAGTRPTLRRMVVEGGLPRRTAVQQIANIYAEWTKTRNLRATLDDAFDVERVTDAFFRKYRDLFEAAIDSVQGFAEDEAEQKRLFVLTLFNRLMFVYFLSRKGWLTFNGERDYLDALWKDYQAKPGNAGFYVGRLVPLFFAGLNNPQSQDFNEEGKILAGLIGKVPFLNGGLFAETDLDRRGGVSVPDEAVRPVLSELFGRFNFTVMESTPFDVEVAVDPEMLGKVFEELVTERHSSGAYYTPRPVVAFMCREALKGYLANQIPALGQADLAAFVDDRILSPGVADQAASVRDALRSLTVVDPACGSGAYLLGMMQELVELVSALDADALRNSPNYLYNLKLHVIERNLHGADKDDFAVNIAMLRLWLSLAVEHEGERPQPLPNLDFKVVCGDSLLAPDPNPAAYPDMFRRAVLEKADALGRAKERHFAASGQAKANAERDVHDAKRSLADALDEAGAAGVVDWRVEFADVFAQRRGFDVAVANPPYVRQEEIGGAKAQLEKLYAPAARGRSDLYCYFYLRALQLLAPGGMHVFICSNSWLDVAYGEPLKAHLLANASVRAVYESAVERQFSTADVNTIISVIQKTPPEPGGQTRFVSLRAEFDLALADAANRREIIATNDSPETQAADLAAIKRPNQPPAQFLEFRLSPADKWGAVHLRAPDVYHAVLAKGAGKLVRLGDVADVKFGIKTGANDFFYLDRGDVAYWGIEERFLAPVMTSPQESRSILVDPATLPCRLFLCNEDKASLAGTAALDYIRHGEAQGLHKRSSVASRRLWYGLGEREPIALGMNKLVDTTARTFLAATECFFTDNFQTFRSQAASITICALMNSSVTQLTTNIVARANFGQGVLEIQTYETDNLLILNPTMYGEVNESIFRSTQWDVLNPSPERRMVDDAVFDALGLTQGERDDVYEAVRDLVTKRSTKAKSRRKGGG